MKTITGTYHINISERLQHVRHLYLRAGFGLSPEEWRRRKDWSKAAALEELFGSNTSIDTLALPDSPLAEHRMMKMSKGRISEARKEERGIVAQQLTNWILRMADTQQSALVERMSLFWHGHFACDIKVGRLAGQQLNSIREHALGSFRELLIVIAKDPAMIRYLNNQQNKKNQPNENFARELMELFTLGRGHYSEKDVKEAARAFTGWSSNMQGEYVFRARQHDDGIKIFMGQSGNFDGEDIIDIILDKRETALFITRKIYRYFVNEQLDESRVAQLANQFYESSYDIRSLLWAIFSSDWFYAPENRGNKIKSPIELIAGMIRQLGIRDINIRSLTGLQRALGQQLFSPPNVAGWPGGKSWIDNSTLMMRLQIPMALYKASEMGINLKEEAERAGPRQLKKLEANINWTPIYKLVEGLDEADAFDELASYLLATPVSVDRESIMTFIAPKKQKEFVQLTCIRLMSLPEYQIV